MHDLGVNDLFQFELHDFFNFEKIFNEKLPREFSLGSCEETMC